MTDWKICLIQNYKIIFRERAVEVMNRTMAVIATLEEAMGLQNHTLTAISIARADIGNVSKILQEVSCLFAKNLWN